MRIEKDVKRKIKSVLDKHGWFWWSAVASPYAQSGIPDICAIRDGVFMAIEAKFGNNEPSPMQKGFLLSVDKEAAFAFVVNEKTLEWFESFMDTFDRACKAQQQAKEVAPEDGALMLNAIAELTKAYKA